MHTVPGETKRFPVVLQRHSFSPRLVARAGDVWRAMQDVVVDQSSSVGWTPDRYLAENTMFVVRTMTVRHEREARIEEPLVGRTWPSRARRDMLFTRQVRLFRDDELLAAATQEWAYLTRTLEPTRAGKSLYDAFVVHAGHPDVALPEETPRHDAPAHHFFDFVTWHGWMDPHGHVNHAAYVDYCDEGIARLVAADGHDPQALQPVAETVHFRAAIGPGQKVTVETRRTGTAGAAGVFAHRIFVDGKVCATATTARRLLGRDDAAWVPA